MAGTRIQSKHGFLWQAILILLPVIVLAALGSLSLRQDKILAEHDAAERAQGIADGLAARIRDELTTSNRFGGFDHSFQIDGAGELVLPAPVAAVPSPRPLDLARLNADQRRLWLAVPAPARNGKDPAALIAALTAFVESNPPENFAAAAEFELGLAFQRQEKNSEAEAAFWKILQTYPGAVSESGLPMAALAEFKLADLCALKPGSKYDPLKPEPAAGPPCYRLETFCSNIVFQPTPLTPYFIKLIQTRTRQSRSDETHTVVRWQLLWQEQELRRRLYAAAAPRFKASQPVGHLLSARRDDAAPVDARSFWITLPDAPATDAGPIRSRATADVNWLAIRTGAEAPTRRYDCFSEGEIGSTLTRMVADDKKVPWYFGVAVEIAGKKIARLAPDLRLRTYYYYGDGRGGKDGMEYSADAATKVLASATEALGNGGAPLTVKIYLTSPPALFERQVGRMYWFGLVIALSTLAALVGLATAWRAFYRQQQLSEMKSNFVSSVSHELRAPIASVRLLAESLERGAVSAAGQQQEYFRFIGQECRRLSSLIENVLDFSRIEQGRKQYEFEPTDLAALARDTVRAMEPYAAEKGVALKWETSNLQPPAANLELDVDGRAIQQALVNLIDNAIKHSPKGETVTVGLEAPAEALNSQPATLNLFVADHGPGIPPAEHGKIFERFYRRGSELRRETQGVGIGLSLVKHIVEAHGGRVAVRSDVGQGSRFAIELPCRKSEIRNPKSE